LPFFGAALLVDLVVFAIKWDGRFSKWFHAVNAMRAVNLEFVNIFKIGISFSSALDKKRLPTIP
jgi:hypothetical protein